MTGRTLRLQDATVLGTSPFAGAYGDGYVLGAAAHAGVLDASAAVFAVGAGEVATVTVRAVDGDHGHSCALVLLADGATLGADLAGALVTATGCYRAVSRVGGTTTWGPLMEGAFPFVVSLDGAGGQVVATVTPDGGTADALPAVTLAATHLRLGATGRSGTTTPDGGALFFPAPRVQ